MITTSSPYGGNIVELKDISKRLDNLARRKPELADAALLFSIPKYHTNFENALVFEGNTQIDDDLIIDTEQEWLEKKRICALIFFGNLHVAGDIINNDEHFWPVLLVDGDLVACNILKGGMPLLVSNDLNVTGYIIPEFNDGPLRVGGDLTSLGYVPRCNDRPEARGHVIGGSVSGLILDARKELRSQDLRRVVIPQALNYGWFNLSTVFAYGREGKTIWREAPLEENEGIVEQIEIPHHNGMDPTSLGKLEKPSVMLERICERIREQIQYDPERYSYPESFVEFVRQHLQRNEREYVLVLPDRTTIDGDLVLDWAENWVATKTICAIACEGNLSVKGDVLNRMLKGGVMLFVEGNLEVDNMVKGGATIMVLGNVHAKGIVIGEYNDGVIRVGGDLEAQAFLLFDHDGFVRGDTHALKHTDDDTEWREILPVVVFDDEDEDYPNVDKIWACQKNGRLTLSRIC